MTRTYHVSRDRPRVEQFVIEFFPDGYEPDPRFLLLTADHLRVYQNPWINALLRLDGDDHGAVLVRVADDVTPLEPAERVRIAISLYKYPSGNLFGLHTDFSVSPPEACPFPDFTLFEEVLGLDFFEQQDRLRRCLEDDKLSLWLAEGGEARIYDDMMSATQIDVRYEATIDLPADWAARLRSAFEEHLEEHNRIPASERDYQQSVRWLSAELPTSVNPIFPDDSRS